MKLILHVNKKGKNKKCPPHGKGIIIITLQLEGLLDHYSTIISLNYGQTIWYPVIHKSSFNFIPTQLMHLNPIYVCVEYLMYMCSC